jgi:hypothetical protein
MTVATLSRKNFLARRGAGLLGALDAVYGTERAQKASGVGSGRAQKLLGYRRGQWS